MRKDESYEATIKDALFLENPENDEIFEVSKSLCQKNLQKSKQQDHIETIYADLYSTVNLEY